MRDLTWAGWLYPGYASTPLCEVERRWPEALVWFDIMCTDIVEMGEFRFVVISGIGSNLERVHVSMPVHVRKDHSARHGLLRPGLRPAIWMHEVGVWRRYTCGVSSRPRRPPRLFDHELTPAQVRDRVTRGDL